MSTQIEITTQSTRTGQPGSNEPVCDKFSILMHELEQPVPNPGGIPSQHQRPFIKSIHISLLRKLQSFFSSSGHSSSLVATVLVAAWSTLCSCSRSLRVTATNASASSAQHMRTMSAFAVALAVVCGALVIALGGAGNRFLVIQSAWNASNAINKHNILKLNLFGAFATNLPTIKKNKIRSFRLAT